MDMPVTLLKNVLLLLKDSPPQNAYANSLKASDTFDLAILYEKLPPLAFAGSSHMGSMSSRMMKSIPVSTIDGFIVLKSSISSSAVEKDKTLV
jgi:hypothetical protein